jgi:hypothetical protein
MRNDTDVINGSGLTVRSSLFEAFFIVNANNSRFGPHLAYI